MLAVPEQTGWIAKQRLAAGRRSHSLMAWLLVEAYPLAARGSRPRCWCCCFDDDRFDDGLFDGVRFVARYCIVFAQERLTVSGRGRCFSVLRFCRCFGAADALAAVLGAHFRPFANRHRSPNRYALAAEYQ